MTKEYLFWLITDQFQVMKCHTIIPLIDLTKHQMIYETIMKRPGYRQKNSLKIIKIY